MPQWNPDLYLRFDAQRTRPAIDLALQAKTLLAARPGGDSGLQVLDLGCGPGNSTAVLSDLMPGCRLTGMDSSPEMIAKARQTAVRAEWLVADAAVWQPASGFDLVFSNAVLQWLPDQAALLGRMWTWLKPGGVLAVQVPGNGESGLHRALRSTASGPAWTKRFDKLDDALHYHEPPFYFDILDGLLAGSGAFDVWETTYWHVLENPRGLIDWYSGTGMRPWLEALDSDESRQRFKDAVLEAAKPSYPVRADGTVLFPFRRIFFTATKLPGGQP